MWLVDAKDLHISLFHFLFSTLSVTHLLQCIQENIFHHLWFDIMQISKEMTFSYNKICLILCRGHKLKVKGELL